MKELLVPWKPKTQKAPACNWGLITKKEQKVIIHREAQDSYEAWLIAKAGDQLGYNLAAMIVNNKGCIDVFLQGSVTTGIRRPGEIPIVDIDEAIEWVREHPSS